MEQTINNDLDNSNIEAKTLLFTASTTKLIIMSIVTLGIYYLYWMYKNWKAIKTITNQDLMPFWRTIFNIFWVYPLFKNIKQNALKNNVNTSLQVGLLAIIYILLSFGASLLDDPLWLISFFAIIPIVLVNNLAIKVNQNIDSDFINNSKFTKWNWLAILIPLSFVALGFFMGVSNANLSSDQSLKRASDNINKDLPIMLDNITRLDKTYGSNSTFTFNHTLIDNKITKIEDKHVLKLQESIHKGLCSSPNDIKWLNSGVIFKYNYYNPDGIFLAEVITTQKDCIKIKP